MIDTPVSGEVDGGEVGGDDAVGDTTVRRPRVPAPPGDVALADTDHASDTVIVPRGSRRRVEVGPEAGPGVGAGASDGSAGEASSDGSEETTAGTVAAYPSRVAAPVRGSRRAHPIAVPKADAAATDHRPSDPLPDASEIRRGVRARARRRLVFVVVAIIGVVVVLLCALVGLVFAAGV